MQAGKATEPAARGPRPPRSPWGPGRRLRLALARRGLWARHAQAADADTATRAGPVGAGGEEPPRARASAARLRPLRRGGVGGAPRAVAVRTSPSHHSPSSSSSSRGRPAPPTPRRTCTAERERNKLCSTAQQNAKNPSRNCVRTHACSVAGLYKGDSA